MFLLSLINKCLPSTIGVWFNREKTFDRGSKGAAPRKKKIHQRMKKDTLPLKCDIFPSQMTNGDYVQLIELLSVKPKVRQLSSFLAH